MKIAVTSEGPDLQSRPSAHFGRCPYFLVVDEDGSLTALPNAAADSASGAGIQAAQNVVDQGAAVVLTGRIGPNAWRVLGAADIPVYMVAGETVAEAVELYRADKLELIGGASPGHIGGGMGGGRGGGRGGGMGGGRGGGGAGGRR
ncbi:MAG: NifB/NifX family molybdenum-iron cluster-binding protein [Candidatus Krumholzibacteriota bacterium]|nr:NifB/NifX family molybdenum-iron cluster-binding protein [Candidatus Krumholzibacteriota bacterium]